MPVFVVQILEFPAHESKLSLSSFSKSAKQTLSMSSLETGTQSLNLCFYHLSADPAQGVVRPGKPLEHKQRLSSPGARAPRAPPPRSPWTPPRRQPLFQFSVLHR